MKTNIKTSIIFLVLAFLPSLVMGWGKGHDLHVEWVLKNLPQEIQKFWSPEQKEQMITHWAHYPDNQATNQPTISADEAKIMGDDYEWIKEATNGGKRSVLHSVHSKGVMFFALAKAFRENRPEASAMYAGILLHSFADSGAFNHGSTMHYLFYTKYKHIKYPKLHHKDLWDIKNNKKIIADAKTRVAKFKPSKKVKNLDDALVDVMMSAAVSAKFLASVEADIGKINSDGSASKESTVAITKVLADQTIQGVSFINDAWLIAKSKQPLDPKKLDVAKIKEPLENRPVYAKFEEKQRAYFKARTPKDDNVYQGLWGNKKYPAIGFVAEAAYDMSLGELGFGSRFATAIIARGMKKSGANVELFSFLDLEKSAPNVRKVPVLVLHAKDGVPARIKKSIDEYLSKGGKLVFIGGNDKGLTGIRTTKRPDTETPVSWKSYLNRGKGEDKSSKMKIELAPRLANISKAKVLNFKDNPNKTGAWNLPIADCELSVEKDVVPLMYLILPSGQKYCVGAAKKVKGKFKFVYLPAYAFLPFMFSDDTSMLDWSRATTDSFGNALAKEAVKILLKNK